jgi:hypothetical protein
MYHIRIDSVYVKNLSGAKITALVGTSGKAVSATGFLPAFGSGINLSAIFNFPQISGTTNTYAAGDTLVVAITEDGKIVPVSISDMRGRNRDNISHKDLQSTLWCTTIDEPAKLGQEPTYHFTNKVFGADLDLDPSGYITSNVRGWMYSPAHLKEKLYYSQPLYYRHDAEKTDVLVYNSNGTQTNLEISNVSTDDFLAQEVDSMLKFTIVEAAPFVLDANAFNTVFGYQEEGLVTLNFAPATDFESNPFKEPLFATTPAAGTAQTLGYLNVHTGSKTGNIIYNWLGEDPDSVYINDDGEFFTKLWNDGQQGVLPTLYNDAYRFIYFPSQDSVVINAYKIRHLNGYTNHVPGFYEDDGTRISDAATSSSYYGLYNKNIHDNLIIRRQTLTTGGRSIMTIGNRPPNIRIHFGINCKSGNEDLFTITPGVYTIWDNRGRALGIRIYNGSLVPQWMELEQGECPDRIPSYQWVIEPSGTSTAYRSRIDIVNREFGDLADVQNIVRLSNIFVHAGESKIFFNQGQFLYGPLVSGIQGYQPINNGEVGGRILATKAVTDCTVREQRSGFRPVNTAYTSERHLGYKWFKVETSGVEESRSDNWSDANGNWLGMDHNAFSFNYLHNYSKDYYINHSSLYNESILEIDTKKEAFQLMLGTKLRNGGYEEEKFGYPVSGYTNGFITYTAGGYATATKPSGWSGYSQTVAKLLRYFYELKVADFYSYRDGLAEQYVVLKGAKADLSDIRNALKYGLADVYADKDPFHFANVYLRETYFLPREAGVEYPGDEIHNKYPNDRVYYAVLDRIDPEEFPRVALMGLEVSDVLRPAGPDESSRYSLVVWGVDDYNGRIKAQGKTVSSARVSTFALENNNYELYRRLNSIRDDGAVPSSGGTLNYLGADTQLDAPKILRIHRQLNKAEYFHEDGISSTGFNQKTINYLGLANIYQRPEDYVAPDGMKKFNYNLYIDTAYINRGTGPIKPQYLIAVGVDFVPNDTTLKDVQDPENCCEIISEIDKTYKGYTYGRYLVNATDSAREIGSNATNTNDIINNDYITNGTWDRLIFVPAIHDYYNDRLYILSEVEKQAAAKGKTITDYTYLKDGTRRYNLDALKALNLTEREPLNAYVYGAFYDFGKWANNHNDVTFSLRFTVPQAKNANIATGEDYGNVTNDLKKFYIESETTDRTPYGNRKIAPVRGGWFKVNNQVVAVSHGSYESDINQGDVFNVEQRAPGDDRGPNTNEDVSVAGIKVIAGTGEVSILNAGGKNVTVSNILGQTLAGTVLSSDNATIKVAKGIVIVQIDGEKAVKAVIK